MKYNCHNIAIILLLLTHSDHDSVQDAYFCSKMVFWLVLEVENMDIFGNSLFSTKEIEFNKICVIYLKAFT